MALLLVLTSAPASEQVLPALELLSHRVRQIPAEPAQLVGVVDRDGQAIHQLALGFPLAPPDSLHSGSAWAAPRVSPTDGHRVVIVGSESLLWRPVDPKPAGSSSPRASALSCMES